MEIKLNNGYKMPILGLGVWRMEGKSIKNLIINAIMIGYHHINCAEALTYTYKKQKHTTGCRRSFVYLVKIYSMAIIPCGGVAQWGIHPQLMLKSSVTNRMSISNYGVSSYVKCLAAQSSRLFSQNSLRAIYPSKPSQYSNNRRGARLVVRADRDYYSVLGVSKNSTKSEIKSAYRKLARSNDVEGGASEFQKRSKLP